MAIVFNHTIVAAKDRTDVGDFFTELFGLPPRKGVRPLPGSRPRSRRQPRLRAGRPTREIRPQHYAFLVSEHGVRRHLRTHPRTADCSTGPIREGQRPGEINHNDGGRGVYFQDPAGHYLEIITRPYGSGGGLTRDASRLTPGRRAGSAFGPVAEH